MVQQFDEKMICVGFDVEQQYPSIEVGEDATMKIYMGWRNVEYMEGAMMIGLKTLLNHPWKPLKHS